MKIIRGVDTNGYLLWVHLHRYKVLGKYACMCMTQWWSIVYKCS